MLTYTGTLFEDLIKLTNTTPKILRKPTNLVIQVEVFWVVTRSGVVVRAQRF